MDPLNFLKQLDTAKTGDGVRRDIDVDLRNAFLPSDASALTTTLTTNPGFVVLETNNVGLRWNATIVIPAGFVFAVPGDYDESKDELKVRMDAIMGGATDTPAITLQAYRKRPGVALATLTAVTGKDPTTLAASTPTSTHKTIQFDLSGQTLKANDQLLLKITPAAHGTDTLSVNNLIVRYRSDIVLFNEAAR